MYGVHPYGISVMNIKTGNGSKHYYCISYDLFNLWHSIHIIIYYSNTNIRPHFFVAFSPSLKSLVISRNRHSISLNRQIWLKFRLKCNRNIHNRYSFGISSMSPVKRLYKWQKYKSSAFCTRLCFMRAEYVYCIE